MQKKSTTRIVCLRADNDEMLDGKLFHVLITF